MAEQEEEKTKLRLEIAHVLFMDIVGYSKLLMDEQSAALQELNHLVRQTEAVQEAEAAGQLVRLPTGDGMALVFTSSVEAPVECALQLSQALRAQPSLPLRMGIHSGPVQHVEDVNGRENVAGAGINIAQRVMDCGDAGHILLSKRVADDLGGSRKWQPYLHELGECEVKHGVVVSLVNLYADVVGNAALPGKFGGGRVAVKEAGTEAARGSVRRRWMLGVGALLALAGAGIVVRQASEGGRRAMTTTTATGAAVPGVSATPVVNGVVEKSIAVLPFDNFSADKDSAVFADGVQDEVLTDLAKVADLKVISRSSVMQYQDAKQRNLREIGKALGVAYVVEGSVQRAGDKIRVTAQLIDARTDAHQWAERYDRNLQDVFAIQSEIAQSIADQLRSNISPAEKALIAQPPTANLAAYALYTQANGIDVWSNWQGAEKGMARKVELLRHAAEYDPNFALAYCAIAKSENDLGEGEPGSVNDSSHLPLAKKAAETALQLRPGLGEAHRELARYYHHMSDFDHASEELTLARRTLPNDAEVFRIAGEVDSYLGRWEEALANLKKAQELDPHDTEVEYHLGDMLHMMRRYREWELLLRGSGTRNPLSTDFWDLIGLAEIKLDTGDPRGAAAIFAQVPMDYNAAEEVWDVRYSIALFLHDDAAVARVIAATPAEATINLYFGKPPGSWADGWIARRRGDEAKAQAAFTDARAQVEAAWSHRDKGAAYFRRLALLDAALGRKEQAIREARQAMETMPMGKDAVNGPFLVEELAKVYALTGEKELAVEQLEAIAKVPNGPTYGELRFDPVWDALRGEARFETVVASLAPR